MISEDIRFEHIKVKDLPSFAEDILSTAKPGQFVPISMQRAVAHSHNPFAAPDDIGLLVAFDTDNEVVGYFGILPLMVRLGDKLHKAHWFTTWNVSSKVRGQGVGARLMDEALSLQQDYLIVGSVYARKVCRKVGFLEREPLLYYWLDSSGMGRLNPIVAMRRAYRKVLHLLRVEQDVNIVTPLTQRLDDSLAPWTRLVLYALLMRFQKSVLSAIHVREVDQLRDEQPSLTPHPQAELHRGVEAVNWLLSYPWVVMSSQSISENLDYFFSDTRPMFRFIALEVYTHQDEYKGFVVFSVSQKEKYVALKILDFSFANAVEFRYIFALAIKIGQQYKADTIEMPHEIATLMRSTLLGRLLLHEKQRVYQAMPKDKKSPLAQAWPDLVFHLYDGDMSFS